MKKDGLSFAERRCKERFRLSREMRYRILEDGEIVATGNGFTRDLSSAGIAFRTNDPLPGEGFAELSISWPAFLDDNCPMQLIVFGRLVRSSDGVAACTVEKYEFRTQPRNAYERQELLRNDRMLQRWVESVRKDGGRAAGRLTFHA
jgi:hypothetical protein